MKKIWFILGSALSMFGCGSNEIPVPPPTPPENSGTISVWRTQADASVKLIREAQKLAWEDSGNSDVFISIDEAEIRQEMEGFGAALTGSAAFVLMNYLDVSERSAVLEDLFDPEKGIGLSVLRLTIGASDFSTQTYSYHDLSNGTQDENLEQFSISPEQQHLIPVLKEILAIAPDLTLIASPWSAPGWMKDTGTMSGGGSLKPAHYDSYALYFVKYLQAMADAGIDIQYLTIQNEPLHEAGYPTMYMSAVAQASFIKDHLGPALGQAGLTTEIIIYDHNWDRIDYPLDILADPVAKSQVAGTAFHCYGGNVDDMSIVHEAHPEIGIFFTECSGGDFSPNFGDNLAWNAEQLLIGNTRNWAKTVLFWNLALNEQHGPKNGGCQDCRGVLTINSQSGSVNQEVEYFLLGHLSKFVRPGAHVMGTPNVRNQGISQVAFRNTDGSWALLAFNHQNSAQEIMVEMNGETFSYNIQARNLVTFHWQE
ncbi:glycoside hydrolase family 30 beta sandwich domain-containing protein [Pontibacter sp. G13]|uniref:glycoside hydrolase family 30 protein n=1 Tax=Pontibacter sp. G13 TaxID=3074898 RepID=UPI00288BBC01|nr:glycoside hydrolase family 30 beta sandwich domain-containing protein [Pontibacter sp. G13]WNJ20881.1 glycoside hydrolase family 30 beta sandwich domain-containing protein [Pontibacter sp. G13]